MDKTIKNLIETQNVVEDIVKHLSSNEWDTGAIESPINNATFNINSLVKKVIEDTLTILESSYIEEINYHLKDTDNILTEKDLNLFKIEKKKIERSVKKLQNILGEIE